jgi:hypothetical protein
MLGLGLDAISFFSIQIGFIWIETKKTALREEGCLGGLLQVVRLTSAIPRRERPGLLGEKQVSDDGSGDLWTSGP